MSRNNHWKSSSGGRQGRTTTRGCSSSHQGARPKMKTDMDSNKNVYMEDRFPRPLPKHIAVMWDSITFCFTKSKRRRNVQQSYHLDIGKVQFALTSDRKKNSIYILKENGVEASVNNKNQIEVKLIEQPKEINNELQYLENIFETYIINDLNRIDIDEGSSEENHLIKEPLEEMKQKTAEVYHCRASNSLFVVGEKTKVQQMCLKKENSDLPISEKRAQPFKKNLSLTDSYLLEYLGFEEHISSSIPGTKVRVIQEPPYFDVYERDDPSINVDNEVRLFLDKIERKALKLSGGLVKKLFFDQYAEPNDKFYCFISNRLPKSLGKVSFYISESDKGEFFVNCLDEKNAQKVAELVEKNIVSKTVKMTGWEAGRKFLNEWSGKKKLFYKEISTGMAQFYCTTDVFERFLHVGLNTRLCLSDNQLKFLQLFGKEFLLNIEKQFGIRATLKETELELTGMYGDLEECKNFLESKLRKLRESIPLDVPIECIENRKGEIDRALNEGECFWHLKTMKTPVKMLENCDYLTSWIDPMRELKVTVVRGFSWYIDLDLQIVMTNQSLYPVDIVQSQFPVPEAFFLKGKDILESKGGKMNVGEYTELLEEMNGCKNVNCVALVICSDNNNKTSKVLDIRQKIKEILTQHVKGNITNFGVNAFEMGGDKNLTRHAIEAALEFADESPGQIEEIFICYQTEQMQELRKVHELFKEKHGFVQNIYSDSAIMSKRAVSDTKVKVIEGKIDELKADIMVNTTNKQLKLDEGRLSSAISEMAGPSLQNECKLKYPDGLKDGQVAKTYAYNLSNLKLIYHISLPGYNVATFREKKSKLNITIDDGRDEVSTSLMFMPPFGDFFPDVKTYVKKCLCQAERDGCCSIVFPALGVGRLKYPRRETAEAMFDAAEEYSLNVINPVLKSIEFLVNSKDHMTYEAYLDEEYRRSKECLKEIGLTKPFIKKDFNFMVFKTHQNKPSMKITTLQDFGVPPAYAIEVFIGQVKTVKEIFRKRAVDEPRSWNERWFLQRAESKDKVTEGLVQFIHKLAELGDRVTEIVIYTNKDSTYNISEEKQVDSICCQFSKKSKGYLQEVIIVVSDETILQQTKKLLKIDGKLAVDRKNTYSESTQLSIELIGKTEECLSDGKTFIKDLIQTIKKEIITTVVSRLNLDTGAQMLQQQDTMDSFGSNNDFKAFDEVTAEINPGIVAFKKQNNAWDVWVNDVEKIFRLKVKALSDNEVTVRGDFSSILRFEDYLDKRFPNDPSAINDS